jgi:hypothetical protein
LGDQGDTTFLAARYRDEVKDEGLLFPIEFGLPQLLRGPLDEAIDRIFCGSAVK